MQPEIRYSSRLSQVRVALAALESKVQRVSWGRLLVFLAAFGIVVAMVWGPIPEVGWWLVGALAVAFVLLVLVHTRLFEARATEQVRARFFEQGMLRVADDWRKTPSPKQTEVPAEHLFADDLDIVGEGGVEHLLPPPATPFGRRALRARLLSPSLSEVRSRQAMVRELSTHHELREQLHVLVDAQSDSTAERAATWASTQLPSVRGLVPLAYGLPLLTLALWGLGLAGVVHTSLAYVSMGLSIVAGMVITPRLAPYFAALEWELHKIQALFHAFETAKLEDEGLRKLQAAFGTTEGQRASDALARLARIASFANARNNEMFRFVLGPILQWDTHAALALETVHRDLGGKLGQWLAVLGELDALCALGTFAFEHPTFVWPEFVDQNVLRAEALAHPLLPEATRKANTIDLEGLWVITGSNMAGKSTLLRAVGVAVVLAYAGAPVCAARFEVGVFSLAASMRIRDSLGDGVSRFYAELRKLKAALSPAGPLLVLLDEMLSGTNMRERVVGAQGILRTLQARGALGLVSTHDLELTTLDFVHNAHFEEQVEGDKMSFDYKLREGVVTSGNALRLMRAMGLG